MCKITRKVSQVDQCTSDGLVVSYLMNLHSISVRIHALFTVNYEENIFLAAENIAFIVQQMRAMETMTMVNDVPCIRFREKNTTDRFFITIFNGSGCYAPVSSTILFT